MEKIRLYELNSTFKWTLSLFFFLLTLGMGVAALQSNDRYHFNDEKTLHYYQGDPAEGELAIPKPYAHLLSVSHVHSFTMPFVFLTIWIALQGVPLPSSFKKGIILGGTLSILLHNSAPYLVRYVSSAWVFLFTVGGGGLFVFFIFPVSLIFYELWFGFKSREIER